MSAIEEFKKLLAEAQKQQKESLKEAIAGQPTPDTSIPAKAAEYLSKSRSNDNVPTAPENIEAQRWNDPLRREPNERFVTFKEMNDHYGLFLQRIQQQMSTMSGGGEVNLRNLDDVDRSTIGPNRHLAYNPTTKKFFFEPVTASEPQAQSDWSVSDTGDVAFIKNKPENLSSFTNDIDRLVSGNNEIVLSSNGVFTSPGSIIPNVDDTFDLGSADLRWQSLYLGPGTIVIEDTVTSADASITVSDGVLQIDGANQLQVGQLKFVDNAIESKTPDIDIRIGELTDTADLLLNRNVVIGTGKTITFSDGTVQSTAPVALADDDYTTSVANNTISVVNLPANTAIGPIEQLSFNTSHTHQEVRVEGTLCWDPDDRTLNLTHPDDVVQQIGQELYGKVRNNTGSTITNGTAVRFAGASMNGTARLEVAPFEADGAFPSLYAFGIATQDIADGEDGLVTVWGKVRDIDTTGAGENWQVGDIIYVSPTTAGALTNIKPTAPNNVVPMAAVLRVDSTEGEIFVRPTIEQKKSYGKFERTTDLLVAAINTAYVIDFDTTEIANGVTRVVGNTTRLQVDQSGLYQIDVSAQVDATGGGFSSGTMFMWVRKNGADVADSTRRQGVLGSAPSANIGFVVVISLAANDYIEIGYAGDSTALRFDAAAATAFAPSTAAVKVGVTQIQL